MKVFYAIRNLKVKSFRLPLLHFCICMLLWDCINDEGIDWNLRTDGCQYNFLLIFMWIFFLYLYIHVLLFKERCDVIVHEYNSCNWLQGFLFLILYNIAHHDMDLFDCYSESESTMKMHTKCKFQHFVDWIMVLLQRITNWSTCMVYQLPIVLAFCWDFLMGWGSF